MWRSLNACSVCVHLDYPQEDASPLGILLLMCMLAMGATAK